ncbi:regulator of G-protein signaling 14-like isoform X3 [Anguilla rostrata]|uniref:regulator of G-protein signaling 14-like isoform X3 n=1 Tax=Anguilla rostrata TaxID=7938 RepID=UPI0030CAA391
MRTSHTQVHSPHKFLLWHVAKAASCSDRKCQQTQVSRRECCNVSFFCNIFNAVSCLGFSDSVDIGATFRNSQNLGVRIGHGVLAVSDGELNMITSEDHGSCHSLDSSPQPHGCQHSAAGKVASWAVSFEKLLKDPTGVCYFEAFLKSEVSAENILFWRACEKFSQIQAHQKEELSREARSIFDNYLSDSAFHAVNIDETARITESDLQTPTPDMFHKAQQQIFKLMKFDSYTRFKRSQLFQKCMLAEMEARPLPGLGPRSTNFGALQNTGSDCSFSSERQNKVKLGKCSHLEMEAERRRGQESRAVWDRGDQQRRSWEAKLSERCVVSGGQRVNSAMQSTVSGPRDSEQGRVAIRQTEKYCCVYLPDGTASLAPARPGVTIRDMLRVLCQKRGFDLCDITLYLQGKDKPLSLDQDSSVLREQQVLLELRVTFAVEIAFMRSRVRIVVKSSKSLQEALSMVLQKHDLRPQDVVLTVSGCMEPLKMDMLVFPLANKTLLLDRAKGELPHSGSPPGSVPGSTFQRRGAITSETAEGLQPIGTRARPNRARITAARKTYDVDALAALLSRVQWCSMDDQRSLLRKEHLVMPSFLELPPAAGEEETEEAQGENRGSEEPSPTSASPPTPSGAPALSEEEGAVGMAAPDRMDSDAQSLSPLSRPDGSFFCSDLSRETVV